MSSIFLVTVKQVFGFWTSDPQPLGFPSSPVCLSCILPYYRLSLKSSKLTEGLKHCSMLSISSFNSACSDRSECTREKIMNFNKSLCLYCAAVYLQGVMSIYTSCLQFTDVCVLGFICVFMLKEALSCVAQGPRTYKESENIKGGKKKECEANQMCCVPCFLRKVGASPCLEFGKCRTSLWAFDKSGTYLQRLMNSQTNHFYCAQARVYRFCALSRCFRVCADKKWRLPEQTFIFTNNYRHKEPFVLTTI